MRRRSLLGGCAAGLVMGLPARAEVGPEPAWATMRDGQALALDVRRPRESGRRPAIVALTLNRRRDADPAAWPLIAALGAAGYVVVSADLRGRHESGGGYDPEDLAQLGRDGFDLIGWVAAQAWSDGAVGMLAQGRAGEAAVASVLEAPPTLKALALWGGGFSRLEPLGGNVRLLDALGDAAEDVAAARPDAAQSAAVQALLQSPAATYGRLRLVDSPALKDTDLGRRFAARLGRAAAPPPWERLALPMFQVCGWYDPAAHAQIAAFTTLRQGLGGGGQHLTIGPWGPGLALGRRVGEMSFGALADAAGAGLEARQIAFFDRHLRAAAGDLAPVRYFLMGANTWRDAAAWPPAEPRRLYLHSRGKANSVAGDGELANKAPDDDPPDRFVFDPAKPTPTLGGALTAALAADLKPGPVEQTPIERRYDVLCYTTPPFERDMTVLGPATLRLNVSTTAADADFAAKLVQVFPDGAAVNLCEGVMRLSGRGPDGAAQPVIAGEVYELTVNIGHTAALIPRGGRLRLQIASANFPLFDRYLGARGEQVIQSVHHRKKRPSYLELALAPAEPVPAAGEQG